MPCPVGRRSRRRPPRSPAVPARAPASPCPGRYRRVAAQVVPVAVGGSWDNGRREGDERRAAGGTAHAAPRRARRGHTGRVVGDRRSRMGAPVGRAGQGGRSRRRRLARALPVRSGEDDGGAAPPSTAPPRTDDVGACTVTAAMEPDGRARLVRAVERLRLAGTPITEASIAAGLNAPATVDPDLVVVLGPGAPAAAVAGVGAGLQRAGLPRRRLERPAAGAPRARRRRVPPSPPPLRRTRLSTLDQGGVPRSIATPPWCCARTSSARPTASSCCSPSTTARCAPSPRACARRSRSSAPGSSR